MCRRDGKTAVSKHCIHFLRGDGIPASVGLGIAIRANIGYPVVEVAAFRYVIREQCGTKAVLFHVEVNAHADIPGLKTDQARIP